MVGKTDSDEKADLPHRVVKRTTTDRAKAIADDPRSQAEKFKHAARELGCDEDEDRFKGVLRKLASRKAGSLE